MATTTRSKSGERERGVRVTTGRVPPPAVGGHIYSTRAPGTTAPWAMPWPWGLGTGGVPPNVRRGIARVGRHMAAKFERLFADESVQRVSLPALSTRCVTCRAAVLEGSHTAAVRGPLWTAALRSPSAAEAAAVERTRAAGIRGNRAVHNSSTLLLQHTVDTAEERRVQLQLSSL